MITQSFLDQLEVGLLKSYNRVCKSTNPVNESSPVFIKETISRDYFTKEFMKHFREHGVVLDSEIRKGGHANSAPMLDQINRMVETKVSTFLFRQPKLDEKSFQNIIRGLKKDVRNLFYENYLGSK